ncbi:MAG: STAS domain-containing protein [Planctomycetes bacterium]|nr:STAS domain-containing protein [Planctomycetota bacterium]
MIIQPRRGMARADFALEVIGGRRTIKRATQAKCKEQEDTVEPYVVQGSNLIVREQNLTREDVRFDKACRQLLEGPGEAFTMDLSGVKVITSTFIGIIAVTYLDALQNGKKITVKAPTRVLDVFRLAGFEGKIEMVEVPFKSGA